VTVRRPPATKISAVVSDIDGTLVTDDKVLTERNRWPRHRCARPALPSPSSAAGRRAALLICEAIGDHAAQRCFNGGVLVAPDSSPIEQHLLPPDTARRTVDLITAGRRGGLDLQRAGLVPARSRGGLRRA